MSDVQAFTAMWPILPPRLPLTVLICYAKADLPDVCALRGVRPVPGVEPRWSIRPGSQVPGSGGAAEVLVAWLPVTVLNETDLFDHFDEIDAGRADREPAA